MPGKFFLYEYKVGDIVTMKKKHPCGSRDWEVVRVGAEVKLRCTGCSHMIELSHESLEKATVAVVSP